MVSVLLERTKINDYMETKNNSKLASEMWRWNEGIYSGTNANHPCAGKAIQN
jgi:hypothetical protein